MPSRNSIACERCRHLRKRCKPPAPCPACRKAGVTCDVRNKARPSRTHRTASQIGVSTGQELLLDQTRAEHLSSCPNIEVPNEPQSTSPLCDTPSPACSGPSGQGYKQVLDSFQSMFSNYVMLHFGYQIQCDLSEPTQVPWPAATGTDVCHNLDQRIWSSQLQENHISHLLSAFRKFMPLHQTILPSDDYWLELSRQITYPSPADQDVRIVIHDSTRCLPIDQIALLFVTLALGSLFQRNFGLSRALFDESTLLVDEYTGEATFFQCFAVHLQHYYVLRVGTANRARALAAFAVHIAHDLGVNKGNMTQSANDLNMLRLYLLIVFSDQYSAQTHGTKPVVVSSDLNEGIFSPMTSSNPDLESLVHMIKLNGRIMESLAKDRSSQSETELADLESLIAQVSFSDTVPMLLSQQNTGDFKQTLEPLVMVHIFWYRIILRLPSLSDDTSWISSISVCAHSARVILSMYFEIRLPELVSARDESPHSPARPASSVLPPTWRQVKRIMIASFVVFWSYWKGEMIKSEATRLVCMALLLLKHQQSRYGKAAEACIRALTELSASSTLNVSDRMQAMVMASTEESFSACSANPTETLEMPTCGDSSRGTAVTELPDNLVGDEIPSVDGDPFTSSFNTPFLMPANFMVSELGIFDVI